MRPRATQFGYTMLAFLSARLVEFLVIVFGVLVSEALRASSMGGSGYFSLKTVLFIPIAFYVGFGYLLVSFLAFLAMSLAKTGVTRRQLMLANVVPLIVWWLASALYVYGSEIPPTFIATWLIAVAVNAVVGWKLIDIVRLRSATQREIKGDGG